MARMRHAAGSPRRLRAGVAALACLLALVASHAALPADLASRRLADLTSPEVARAVRSGTTTILVPLGGTEQNGPHMTLGKHNVRVEALAGRIALALGNALVAPVVAYVPEGAVNPPTGHMRYPGTISIPPAAFEQVLEGAARSFRAHGFRDIVFLCDHGDYLKGVETLSARLTREWAKSGVRVHALPEYYRASTAGFGAQLRAQGYSEAEIGVHAGLADTALALATAPATVRGDALAQAGHADGVRGDPRRATAELGERGADAVVRETVAAIRAATRR